MLVHGNNDTLAAVEIFRRTGVTLHRREREACGYRFVGFGGDGSALHDVELAEGESMDLRLQGAMFLTHVPPRAGLRYGADVPPPAVAARRAGGLVGGAPGAPRAHVCGHVHRTEGVAWLGQTKVIKLRAAMWNRAALLDLATLRTEFIDLDPRAARGGPPPYA